MPKKIKNPKKEPKVVKEKISKRDQADILGNRFDKKFMKLAESKETQLHAKDFDKGLDRAEDRAIKETMQDKVKMKRINVNTSFIGIGESDYIKTDLKRLRAKANKMKKSTKKAERDRGIQLARQVSFAFNMRD